MTEPEIGTTRPVEVAERVWAYAQHDGSWWINTTGFITGSRVLAIDACATEERTRRFIDAIAVVAGRRPSTLVNTHMHGDHTFGNCLFDNAVVVAHRRCRDAMVAFARRVGQPGDLVLPTYERMPRWGDLAWRLPDITFESRLDLWVDDLEVQLWHPGRVAHTDNDVVVWIPDRRVLFSGDLLFHGGTPLAVGGSVAGSITTLEWLREFGPDVIVPGHGQPCGTEQIDFHIRYWRMVQAAANQTLADGLTPVEAAREIDQGEFAELSDGERIVMNLHRAYAELDPSHEFDIESASADAVAFAGHPIRCVA